MGDDIENTQTQTQNSQVEWSQHNTPNCIPNIWGRLYSTKVSISGRHCWKNSNNPEYVGTYTIFLITRNSLVHRRVESTFKLLKF